MPQIKRFTAKKDLTLDCGHTVKAGAPFQVVSVYTCEEEASWPLKILLATLKAQCSKEK